MHQLHTMNVQKISLMPLNPTSPREGGATPTQPPKGCKRKSIKGQLHLPSLFKAIMSVVVKTQTSVRVNAKDRRVHFHTDCLPPFQLIC